MLGKLTPHVTMRWFASSLNRASLKVQGEFITRVVASSLVDRRVQVVTSARGARKSTCVASMSGNDDALLEQFGTSHIPNVEVYTIEDLPETTSGSEMVDKLLGKMDHIEEIQKPLRMVRGTTKLVQALVEFFPAFVPKSWSKLAKESKSILPTQLFLFDDVLNQLQTRHEVEKFFRGLLARLNENPKHGIILFSSNEGIERLLLDPTTFGAVLRLNTLPFCSKDELTLCLTDILALAETTTSGSRDEVTFITNDMDSNTLTALRANPELVQSIIDEVVLSIPKRYAFSLRFWNLLLGEVKCEVGMECNAVQDHIMEIMRSAPFMLIVAEKLDMEAAGPFRDFALRYSPPLPPDDHAKLTRWVVPSTSPAPFVPAFVPAEFPSRLALLQALKAVARGRVDDIKKRSLKNCEMALLKLDAQPATATGCCC